MLTEFRKYMHIERIGTEDTEGLLDNPVTITAKVDGTNGVIWYDGEQVRTGSRKRALSLLDDNAGFCQYILNSEEAEILRTFVTNNPNLILYGEWMGTPGKFIGAIKDYDISYRSKFLIFDVFDIEQQVYLPDNEWRSLLNSQGIDTSWFTEILAELTNPTQEELLEVAKNNKFMLSGANHPGEGIVIKASRWFNKYGRQQHGKLVLDEYKQNKSRKQKIPLNTSEVIQSICNNWVTDAELSKAVNKTCQYFEVDEFDKKQGKMIGFYLNTVLNDCIFDEMGDIVKKLKFPEINFTTLKQEVTTKAKQYIGLI